MEVSPKNCPNDNSLRNMKYYLHMGETRICIKCGRKMLPGKDFTPKRSDAKQCKDCKRKQIDESSHKIKKIKRGFEKLRTSRERARRTGAEKQIEDDILQTLEVCLGESKYPSKEEFKFLKDQIIYEFEKEDLPKNVQDDFFTKLRKTKFKNIFDEINS